VFHRYGNEYFLVQVWTAGDKVARNPFVSKRALELAQAGFRPEDQIIRAFAGRQSPDKVELDSISFHNQTKRGNEMNLNTMRKQYVIPATLLLMTFLAGQANASTFGFSFAGHGVSGTIHLTYGTATDAKYPNAYEVTGISGTFSDSNHGLNIVNAPILGLEPLNYASPTTGNLLAPADFSKFYLASSLGLPQGHPPSLTYDNLLWPGGSPITATGYPKSGGFFDIYGLMFDIGNNEVAGLWSIGNLNGSGVGPIYGVGVATAQGALDYQRSGLTATPEPGTFVMLGSGILGLVGLARRKINL
jgi:hypothetical protein